MFRQTKNLILAAALIVPLTQAGTIPVLATDAKVAPIQLTPEEIAERESRKACKIEICSAFRAKVEGSDIACNVTKSWRQSQLNTFMQKAYASWPWGAVQCKADLKLNRADMIKSMTEASYEMVIQKHTVACTIARGEEEPAKIEFSFSPKVKFENGIAKQASLNWGEIKAPTVVNEAMWAATATDNTFNMLESTLVEDINTFISKQCDEVKSEWQQ